MVARREADRTAYNGVLERGDRLNGLPEEEDGADAVARSDHTGAVSVAGQHAQRAAVADVARRDSGHAAAVRFSHAAPRSGRAAERGGQQSVALPAAAAGAARGRGDGLRGGDLG